MTGRSRRSRGAICPASSIRRCRSAPTRTGRSSRRSLGFTNADGTGVYGLEGKYNALVGGEPGILVAETDAARQPLAFGQQEYRAPVEGADLVLTIDASIQRMAEDELARTITEQGATGGTILVMDPNTGAILASASSPTYDPNAYNVADPQAYLNPGRRRDLRAGQHLQGDHDGGGLADGRHHAAVVARRQWLS